MIDISTAAVAVVVFLFWPALSVAIVLAVILLLVLGFTELVRRRLEPSQTGPLPPG